MPRDTARPRPRPAAPRGSPATVFRDAIQKAELDGVARDEMTLRLTLSDTADIKRDRSLAVDDLSFAAGVMRFLGVKVASGGVEASNLDRGAA